MYFCVAFIGLGSIQLVFLEVSIHIHTMPGTCTVLNFYLSCDSIALCDTGMGLGLVGLFLDFSIACYFSSTGLMQ